MDIDPELMTFIGELLVLGHPGAAEADFAVRFAQVSSPVMAKGSEDTSFYRYQALISASCSPESRGWPRGRKKLKLRFRNFRRGGP